jgi:SAM-dependent methyltransferase
MKFEMSEKKKEWFDEWFNTIYYHILYKHRDDNEAVLFINNLINYFKIGSDEKILDLACGKGRHSIYLNQKGFDVEGIDLSEQNIKHASQYENDRLKFEVKDMRDIYKPNTFNYIFNLFTSFGYFDSKEANLNVIDAAIISLKQNGILLIDFLNPYVVINNLVKSESKTIENIKFNISRSFTKDEFILKQIEVKDHSQQFKFYEKVKAIRRQDFLNYFDKNGITVLDTFGDYNLNEYVMEKSQRLIFVVKK